MKKFILVAMIVAASVCTGIAIGANAVIHSDGWIDPDKQEFVIDFAGNYYAWDISEE